MEKNGNRLLDGLKENNEITVKIRIELDKFYDLLENKGYSISYKFSMNDTYFIPKDLEIDTMTSREILSKAILVRDPQCVNSLNRVRSISTRKNKTEDIARRNSNIY